MRVLVSVFFLLFFQNLFSQKDSISVTKLKEVNVHGKITPKSKKIAQKTLKITEKQLTKNHINFTNLLRYNSPISFRDYGNGGVSTARFRGTSASNTLVLWNGIPINAIGSGQTDFNSLSANLSDNIIVESGGASAEYGSGAIGGTVHLKNNLTFKDHRKFQIFSSVGSFNTTSNFFKSSFADKKWSVKLGSTFNYSDNDYTFIDNRYKDNNGNLLINENGNYKNYGINFSIAHKFSHKSILSFFTTGYYGDRLFSDGLPNPSSGSERNEDFNQRNLLRWKYNYSSTFKQLISVAYLTQEYRYYNNKHVTNFSFGKSKTTHANYSLVYKPSNLLSVEYSTVFENINGDNSEFSARNRNSIAFTGNIIYQPFKKVKTNLQVRKEINSDFNVPIAVFLGGEYNVTKQLFLSANISSNYRTPTYNETYWPVVGNSSLIPEKSTQVEFGLNYKNKNLQIKSTVFYINLRDKILWLPTGGSNLWRPLNVNNVVNKGIETSINYSKKIGSHNLGLDVNHTFVIAKDEETSKILPFAPKHLVNYTLSYSYNRLYFFLQGLYQSKTYTNQTNIDFYSLAPVNVQNIGVTYKLSSKNIKLPTIGFTINNVFNEVYYFSNLRPMPGKNFNITINYKF